MFELIPYKAEHLIPMMNNTFNSHLEDWIQSGYANQMEKRGMASTIVIKNEFMVCGGVTEYWPGRAQLWTIFNENCKFNFVPTFRGIKQFLTTVPYHRIELCVPLKTSYEDVAKRRAELLGFELECECAKKYLMNGGDAALYALIREGV